MRAATRSDELAQVKARLGEMEALLEAERERLRKLEEASVRAGGGWPTGTAPRPARQSS